MQYRKLINDLAMSGLICDRYKDNVVNAKSKIDIVKQLFDINGIKWLCAQRGEISKKINNTLLSVFYPYINNRYVYTKIINNRSYTSTVFCNCNNNETIDVDTNIVGVVDSIITIKPIASGVINTIVLDNKSKVTVICSQSDIDYINIESEKDVIVKDSVIFKVCN